MTPPDDFEATALDALTRAVAKALERKRLLGQYAVVWQDGRAVCIGPDAPTEMGHSAGNRDSEAENVSDSPDL